MISILLNALDVGSGDGLLLKMQIVLLFPGIQQSACVGHGIDGVMVVQEAPRGVEAEGLDTISNVGWPGAGHVQAVATFILVAG